MVHPSSPKLITVQEAASRIGVSTQSIRRWISSGLIRGVRVGPKLIRVDAASLDNLGAPLQYVGGDTNAVVQGR